MHRFTRLPVLMAIFALLSCQAHAQGIAAKAQENVLPLAVRTPIEGYNRLVVALTVCEPGTARCATIDNIMIDTGSTGLRLQAAALPAGLRLPALPGPSGRPMGECLQFVSSSAWGAMRTADVHFGGLKAEHLPIQVIEQGPSPSRPASCASSNVHPTSNGTLGIGTALSDCHGACIQSADAPHPRFFECDPTGCMPLVGAISPDYRLPNPVTRLPVHNNGIVIDVPAPPAGGAREARGTLTFGVGTAPNNQLAHARLLPLRPDGHFTTLYKGQSIADSYFDTGTESYIFPDAELPRCPRATWAYCVQPEATLHATLTGASGASIDTAFRVGDFEAIRERGLGAMDGAAVASNGGKALFVWGAPFFMGRRVSILIQGMSPPGSPEIKGPLYAY